MPKCFCGRPGPRWGSLQRSPRPPSWINGGLLLRGGGGRGKGRGGEGRGEEERERERRGKEGRRGEGGVAPPPFSNSWIRPCHHTTFMALRFAVRPFTLSARRS